MVFWIKNATLAHSLSQNYLGLSPQSFLSVCGYTLVGV